MFHKMWNNPVYDTKCTSTEVKKNYLNIVPEWKSKAQKNFERATESLQIKTSLNDDKKIWLLVSKNVK